MLRDDDVFITNIVSPIAGFLDLYAAKRTIDLLNFQQKSARNGSLYEVGVYHGKYFAILARSACLTGSRIVGIDCFEYLTPGDFDTYFGDKFDPASLKKIKDYDLEIVNTRSCDLSADSLKQKLRSEARFVSIDGSHEYDDVLWDLGVANQVIAPSGIVAVDDFLHPISLGVTAAVYEFVFHNPGLVPFAYVSNKLFLCRSSWADRYRSALEMAIIKDEHDPKSVDYRQHLESGRRDSIESRFRGYRILTVRL